MELPTIKVNHSFVIFSGLFSYNQHDLDRQYLTGEYVNWLDTIEQENVFKFYRNNYYSNYTNIIISKKCFYPGAEEKDNFRHLCLKNTDCFNNLILSYLSNGTENKINFKLEQVELFLFSEKLRSTENEYVGIYTMRVCFNNVKIELSQISEFVNGFRGFDTSSKICYNDEQLNTLSFIEKYVVKRQIKNHYIDNFSGNKLKSFIVIDTEKGLVNLDNLLYDLGCCVPVGSAEGNTFYSPSEEYYTELLKKNKISVFKNWKAITLFDTFCCISENIYSKSWEQNWSETYFFIFIHCLHLKFNLYRTNAEIADVTNLKDKTETIKNDFVEFLNDYNLSQISFNFLPNIIYHKIRESLYIHEEIQSMERKITQINDYFGNKRQQKLNKLLTLITLIGLMSAIWDLSEFIRNLMGFQSNYYPIGGVGILTSIAILVFVFYYVNFRRDK